MKNCHQFFGFARERYEIFLKKKLGLPAPWTRDQVLRSYYFCNVFREDDKTTAWFRENVRGPLRDDPRVLTATIQFRWFNSISTAQVIKDHLLGDWFEDEVRRRLAGKHPLVTGAYIIKTPDGMTKLEGVLKCIADSSACSTELLGLWSRGGQKTLEWGWDQLQKAPYLGRFMAYEVITDLRHTYLFENAPDVMTWASAGPGCARGLGWLLHDDPGRYGYNSAKDQRDMLGHMTELLTFAGRDWHYWPKEWPTWEMREVEHVLCEYDKWRRGKEGVRLKRRYAG